MATSPFPFTYPPPPARNPPLPTQIHGYHHPSPFFYPSPTQIHGGLYPPPLYSGGYYSATPTYPDQAPATSSNPPAVPYAASYPYPNPTHIDTNGEPDWPSPAPDPYPPILVGAPPTVPPLGYSHPPAVPKPVGSHSTASNSKMQPVPAPLLELQDSDADAYPPPPPRFFPTPVYSTADHTLDPSATDWSINRLPSSSSTVAKAACAPSSDEDDREQDALQRRATDLFLDQTSFDAIQGQCAKIISMLSQLAVSLGRTQKVTSAGAAASVVCGSSASTTNTAGSTTTRKSSSRVSSAPSTSPSTATGYAALHMFDEMPTSPAGYDHYCSGHQTPAQFSCVQEGSTNFSERKMFGEMPTTASAPSFGFTPSSGSKVTASTTVPATATSASTVPSAPAYVAPQVFGEMPKPISGQDGNSYLSEQKVEGMHQAYGLQNLICQTVVRADGSEHSYYALPETYPLARANSKQMVAVYDGESDGCSNESVPVLTSTPEQLTYEEEKQESEQLDKCLHKASATASYDQVAIWKHPCDLDINIGSPKCFSKPIFSLERPTVGIDSVFSLQNEELIFDSEKLNVSDNQFSAKQNIEQLLNCSNKASQCRTCDEESQGVEKILWEHCQTATRRSILSFPWDPGATKFLVLFRTAGGTTKLQGTNVYKSEFSPTTWELTQLSSVEWSTFQVMRNYIKAKFSVPMMQNAIQNLRYGFEIITNSQSNLAVSLFTHHMLQLLVLAASCKEETENCLTGQELMATTSGNVAALTWHNSITGTPFVLPNNINCTWDPSVLKLKDTILDKCPVPHQVHFVQHRTKLSLLSLEFSINSPTSVQWDPGVKMCFDSWLNILTIWSVIDTPLSCAHIPDLAVGRNQSVDSGASYIWDPGTMLLWYNSKWWLLYTEEKTSWHEGIKCYGVALWLIHFQPP